MAAPSILHLTESTFDKELTQRSTPVIVDFWAEWCAPCRMIAPVLEELANEYPGGLTVAKVNVDSEPALAARYGIRSIPTLLFMKGGEIIDQVIGAVPKAQIKKKLDALA
jgi:thioredoxin 1